MSPESLVDLYRQLYLIRRVEEVVADLYSQMEMRCPVHLCLGHEAIPVGVSFRLNPSDYVFGTHRSHGHYLAKGGNLRALVAEFYGRQTGCSGGKGGSMHLIDLACGFLGAAPILGATTSLAVGAAFGTKLRGEAKITVAYLGDGALEEGIFYESANFAATHQLPVLFVCENNQLSVHSQMDVRQPNGRKISEMVQGLGVRALEGDGTDLPQILQLAADGVQHIRSGAGPVFLELHAYRWREHCGPNYDFNLGYRSKAELDDWMTNRCPVANFKKHLLAEGVWKDAAMIDIMAQVDQEVAAAIEFARVSPFPGEQSLLEDEFAPASVARDYLQNAA